MDFWLFVSFCFWPNLKRLIFQLLICLTCLFVNLSVDRYVTWYDNTLKNNQLKKNKIEKNYFFWFIKWTNSYGYFIFIKFCIFWKNIHFIRWLIIFMTIFRMWVQNGILGFFDRHQITLISIFQHES